MAWRRPDDKPLSERWLVYWRIYASLCLNELNIDYSKVDSNEKSKYKHFQSWLISCKSCKFLSISYMGHSVNPLTAGDTICLCRTWSTLVKALTCCLLTASHYLWINQCWIIKMGSCGIHRLSISQEMFRVSVIKCLWKLQIQLILAWSWIKGSICWVIIGSSDGLLLVWHQGIT